MEGHITLQMMQHPMKKAFAASAEFTNSDSSCASAASDAYFAKTLTAIITMMAVVLFAVVRHLIVPDVLISIIIGAVILVIVRKKAEPVSRT